MIYNQWYGVFPGRKLKINTMISLKRLGLELVLFRTKSGKLGCVTDRCSHRGAALSAGKLKGDCLQCPFHGLEFDHVGRCKLIPANGKASLEDLSRFNVQSYTVREYQDMIYLWYGEDDKISDKLPFFEEYLNDSYVYSEIEDSWNSHYSRCIENQLDVVHLPFVHHNTIGRGNRTLVNGPKVIFDNGVIITSANNDLDEGQTPKAAVDCEIKETFLAFKFPNLWMNHISPKIKVVIFFAPVDEENTVIYIRFYNKITGVKVVNRFISFLGMYGNRLIERQDKRVVITQKPKASEYKSAENLIMGDGPIITYRRIRNELKEENIKE